MNEIFFFVLTLSKDIPSDKIKSEIPQKIADQLSRLNNGMSEPDNIRVIEYAYVDAEPNCWLVYATWEIIKRTHSATVSY